MNQQEPLEKEELQTTHDTAEPVEPPPHHHHMHQMEGLEEPKIKNYMPLQVGIVIFSIAILALIIFGISSNMWGLMD
ncbi:MAG TPA: hypothetical protein VLQ20_14310 [Planococcus sp. (in: firmicutes)]|nr:hypothetical protein [Planococcus sp. (in: firmicutes)]